VWWFNDEHPRQYDTLLSAQPPGESAYEWKVVGGKAYGELGPNRRNEVRVEGIKEPPPGENVTVDIAVTVNRVRSDPIELPVRMPYKLEFLPCPRPPCDQRNATYGYLSFIGYKALDQNGVAMPHIPVPWNERFNNDFRYDPPWNANCPAAGSPPCWRQGVACLNPLTGQQKCGESDPQALVDLIGGEAVGQGYVPEPQKPQTPLGTTKVDRFTGSFYVGGGTPGDGVEVQRHRWQKFRDHGRHTNIQSPPP
jgi:hypothetical protein